MLFGTLAISNCTGTTAKPKCEIGGQVYKEEAKDHIKAGGISCKYEVDFDDKYTIKL